MRRKSWLRGLVLGVLVVLSAAQVSFGAGFALYEGSARGNALGGAMVGRADDPSALFFNPAGITQLEGIQVVGGATAIMPKTDVTTENPYTGEKTTTTTEDNVWVPPHLYATYQFTDRVWFGLGLFSPFGLGTEFEEDWPGRYNSYKAVIQSLTINPNIAVKLNDQLSMAAGIDIMWFDLDLRNKIRVPIDNQGGSVDMDHKLTGDSFGYGVNLGLHYKACEWMRLGFSYRSQIKQNVEGSADFSGPIVFEDTDAGGDIVLPDMFFFGAAFYPMKQLSVELGAVYTRWSTYDQLTIRYEKPLAGVIRSVTRVKDWEDTIRIQLGAEYKALDWLDLRASYIFDQEPVNSEHADYLVPANDRHLFGFGPGFRWKNWTADLSYNYIYITDRHVDARLEEGVLESDFEDGNAHLVGLSVGYKF